MNGITPCIRIYGVCQATNFTTTFLVYKVYEGCNDFREERYRPHRLIPQFNNDEAEALRIAPKSLLDVSQPKGGRSCSVRRVFREKNP